MPDKVTLRIRLQPVGLDVLKDLVQSGDLDASVLASMQTYAFPEPMLTWTAAAVTMNTTYFEGARPVEAPLRLASWKNLPSSPLMRNQ